MRKALPKVVITPERKAHYSNLNKWLREHPEIKYQKLVSGFSIDTSTIPLGLEEEFIEICTFLED